MENSGRIHDDNKQNQNIPDTINISAFGYKSTYKNCTTSEAFNTHFNRVINKKDDKEEDVDTLMDYLENFYKRLL